MDKDIRTYICELKFWMYIYIYMQVKNKLFGISHPSDQHALVKIPTKFKDQ